MEGLFPVLIIFGGIVAAIIMSVAAGAGHSLPEEVRRAEEIKKQKELKRDLDEIDEMAYMYQYNDMVKRREKRKNK